MNRSVDRDRLVQVYMKERLTYSQLAERFGITRSAVAGILSRYKEKHGADVFDRPIELPPRPKDWGDSPEHWHKFTIGER